MKLATALASIALTLTVVSGTASISQARECDYGVYGNAAVDATEKAVKEAKANTEHREFVYNTWKEGYKTDSSAIEGLSYSAKMYYNAAQTYKTQATALRDMQSKMTCVN